MKKKILALFLCCVIVLGLLPTTLAFADETELKVSADTVSLKKSETKDLTADAGTLSGTYQWQIQTGAGVWVNILGANGKTLTLKYGLVASLLQNNTARIRCHMTTDAGKALDSNVVTVEIQPNAAVAKAPAKAPAMFPAIGTVVTQATPIGDPVIVSGDTTVPAAEQSVTDNAPDSAPVADAAPATDASLAADATPAAPQSDDSAQNEVTNTPPAPTPTTYSIIINYIFADGKQAAPSWSATVATGSTYTQDIQSPVVVGYTPSEEVVHVNTSEARIYNVIYQPAEVEFIVKHYQQNVSNDGYTLANTETKKGYTGSPVGENLAKTDYTGFYSLLYDTTTKIAADGSTVVEVRYDRYYYLMNFNLDGGYGVEPIYARYGAAINVDTPTKPGYNFAGWDKTIPNAMPANNTTFKANWTVDGQAKVTVVVWGENADDENYSYIKSSEILETPGEKLTLSGLQVKLICSKEEHTHNNSCGISCVHNTHDLTCYGLSANARPVTPDNEALKYFAQLQGGVQDGYIYYFDDNGWNSDGDCYYLRLNGKYYQYSSKPTKYMGSQVGSRVTCDEGIGHADDYFYKYNLKAACTHTHTDSCYTCGKEEHTHTSACYYNTSFMDNPDLWNLVRSDEVTVAADGTSIINVYYDRVEFTLHFRKAHSSYDNYGTIKAKWGANIREAFNEKCKSAGTSNWSATSNAKGPWTSYLDIMPTEGRTYYANTEGYGTSTAYYYVEGLDGKDKLFYENKSTGSGYTVTVEEFIDISGFTFDAKRSSKVKDDFDGAKFYYTRNSYELRFYNHDTELTDKAKTVKYEAQLSGYNFTPDYPAVLEPNAYVFDGWYTTAGCYEGSKADLNTMTMPASNVILYAKWVPKTHTVMTWLTNEMIAVVSVGNTDSNVQTIAHGTTAVKPEDPKNGNYTFVGWFYEDNGVEKAFDFSMPVNRDLNLYAKWSSNTLMNFEVRYKLEDGTEIAQPFTGSALAGSTKTFNAKTGTQLNEGYQSGYFPNTSSHSVTIDIANPYNNTFTFVYVPKAEVTYTVKYLEKGTNNQLAAPKTVKTRDAVVTETFKQITGYAPDAYQKQLVLSADDEENEIIFWYVKDTIHAPVQVIHWIQNIEGDGYTEYQSSTNLNGVIETEYFETPLTIAGFSYNGTESNASGKLTVAGLVLNLYYDRVEYPYEFRFVEKDSNPEKQLAESVRGTARYQKLVTQKAKDIPGYMLVSAENQAINIAIEDGTTAVKNVKIFYYTEQVVNIKYEVVGPDGCGTLDNYQDVQLKVTTGEVKGSAPTAADGFKFVGWYKDQGCTQPVDVAWVADSKLTPGKTKNYGTAEAPVMGYEAATYYAKFEYDVVDLTITKTGWKNIDEGQSFIFDVTDPNGYSKRVVINGNGYVTIKGLKIGTYTVTEVTSWSWRYKPDGNGKEITLKPGEPNTVTFTNSREKIKWLGGDDYNQNKFGNSN